MNTFATSKHHQICRIRAQQAKARDSLSQIQIQLQTNAFSSECLSQEEACRQSYVAIRKLALLLMQQQCKVEWIRYGDGYIKLSFAKANQREDYTYIYSLKNSNGDM